jgi:hypothetical protein
MVGVGGSNPLAPTNRINKIGRYPAAFFVFKPWQVNFQVKAEFLS